MRRSRTPEQLSRDFWSHVKWSEYGCWNWTAALSKSGYGQFCWMGKVKVAHRIAYEMTTGPIPEGVMCCHKCDNRRCVNPEHLFLGSAADNNSDCRAKGRNSPPPRNNILTDAQASEIRSKYIPHKYSAPMLAREYGVGLGPIKHAIYKTP